MKGLLVICTIVYVCSGCKNSNVYSRGELPPWYEEYTTVTCSEKSDECLT